ncbi:hypothetical protein FDH08_gp08 [Propionibacterium phage B22]|uniref:Uncharacterized protein n=5 Tax=root TaxID=1 RepID=A0A1D8ETN8_9CAUD|nr:hypothetical protein [Propionibacterium freudenreichii]YP_009596811.1 hypothetical protein FDH08_gp08 [Propionibacterium phage B22]YP_009596929.1 hypothetical protein FDH10_gp08 [Propionibacterium phage Doucette]YP_009596991.1 hypothetical protein FDH11_gp09 [Propionibacterium phage E6]YP_009597050.1 hypothetical protein FDH12_gp08 [Propionibacterium phage G4]AOT24360.1 hypothetical protein B22_8 [Propionibacterium phage B22]AOT24421.1 hypothetical protein DOUCETTE_8 [Propionibacterium pha
MKVTSTIPNLTVLDLGIQFVDGQADVDPHLAERLRRLEPLGVRVPTTSRKPPTRSRRKQGVSHGRT